MTLRWGKVVSVETLEDLVLAACRDAGLAAPVLEEIGIRFRVTLRTAQVQSATLDKTARAIVALVRAPEGLATREIADRIGLTPRATRTRLAALVALGLVRADSYSKCEFWEIHGSHI